MYIDMKWGKCDKKLFLSIQYGRQEPFCEEEKSKIARNAIEAIFWHPK